VPNTIHLRPTAPLAERVLLPGDPGRALLLAQALLEGPRMFNHNRGLWGYTGQAVDGKPLSIQSTGMGGPSAAIVITELLALGAKRLLRVGTCGGLEDSLALGELLIASAAISDDGTSRALSGGEHVLPASPAMLDALLGAAGGEARAGYVVTTDLFYDGPPGSERRWLADGALAVEMETATLFALAARHGFEAGSLLIVSDLLVPSRRRIDEDRLRSVEHRLGELAVRALGLAAAHPEPEAA
jgi:DeoD family purine-nucleoside phosphorylase